MNKKKSEYSSLGKVFNKGLDKEEDKKELFKRLKNIEKNQNSNINDKSTLSESNLYFPHQVVLEVKKY